MKHQHYLDKIMVIYRSHIQKSSANCRFWTKPIAFHSILSKSQIDKSFTERLPNIQANIQISLNDFNYIVMQKNLKSNNYVHFFFLK